MLGEQAVFSDFLFFDMYFKELLSMKEHNIHGAVVILSMVCESLSFLVHMLPKES